MEPVEAVRPTPAQCMVCGGPALTFRESLLSVKPTRRCNSCDATVRVRGYRGLVFTAILLAAVLLLALVWIDYGAQSLAFMVLMVVLGFQLERWTWTVVPWDPVEAPVAAEEVEEDEFSAPRPLA